MTDRQMLEDAARAAGIVGLVEEYHRSIGDPAVFLAVFPEDGSDTFDPLNDDGDALKLAVKLRFEISVESGVSYVVTEDAEHFAEPHGNDPYAATRLAITRAAASIGAKMRGEGHG